MGFKYTLKHVEVSMKERKLQLERVRSYIRNSYVDPERILSDAQFRTEIIGHASIAVRGGIIEVEAVRDDDILPEERIDPPTDLPNRPL